MQLETQPGEILLLRELNSDPNVIGKYVRVTGYVDYVDKRQRLCVISHNKASVQLDISMIGTSELRDDSLVQVIGEVRFGSLSPVSSSSSSTLSLQQAVGTDPILGIGDSSSSPSSITAPSIFISVKILRCVDGLDMDLFEAALIERRKFLSRPHGKSKEGGKLSNSSMSTSARTAEEMRVEPGHDG